METSQTNLILQTLLNNAWVCGTDWQKMYIPEYRSRVNVLRRKGHTIEARRCSITGHNHKGGMQMWRLVSSPLSEENKVRVDKVISKVTQEFLRDWPSAKKEKQTSNMLF